MKKHAHLLAIGAAMVVTTGIALLALPLARGLAGPASASAGAAASASAVPLPSIEEPPPLSSRPIPSDRSDPPRGDAWAPGEVVEVTRRSIRARQCKAYLLREYLKVSCPMMMGGVRQLAGANKDTQVWVQPKKDTDLWEGPQGGQVIFPLRRGQGFVFRFFTIESEYEGFGIGDGVIVDAWWPAGDRSPTVVLR